MFLCFSVYPSSYAAFLVDRQQLLLFDIMYLFGEYEHFIKSTKDAEVIWTAMIHAHGMHGQGKEALKLFKAMQQRNIKPTTITITCILNACSQSGLVEQAWKIYNSMEQQYGIIPTNQHQVCMVDVWGRARMLDTAENFIEQMTHKHVSVWQALLGASRNSGDVERAKRAASQILELIPKDAATHVLLANTYAAAGNWEECEQVWSGMQQQNIKKIPGTTWVTIMERQNLFMCILGITHI